ncbi:MAG TPA: hypothetical protein VLS93_03845 [Anaeromyxobacteraceae bacterium]|nr:hypothetical protein [Anaeromyxobacteraceae bacterium]
MKRTAWSTAAIVLGVSMVLAACKGEEKKAPARTAASRTEARKPEARSEEPARAAEPSGPKVVKQLGTAGGRLEILRHGGGQTAKYSARIGDRELVDERHGAIEVAAVHGKPTRLVLLRLAGTNKACPALFRVVEAVKDKKPKVSDEFGNCNPKPGTAAVKAGWRVSFPKYGKAAAKSWTYADGDVEQVAAR